MHYTNFHNSSDITEFSIFHDRIKMQHNQFNLALIKRLDDEVQTLKLEAEMLINDFFIKCQEVKHKETMSEWAILHVRIKPSVHSFTIAWRECKFNYINGKWKVFWRELKISQSKLQYNFIDAKKAKAWELEYARKLEMQFVLIRKRLQQIIHIRRYLR